MNFFGLFINTNKDNELKCTEILVESILRQEGNICLSQKYKVKFEHLSNITFFENELDLINKSDILISLGGDGTFLKTARKCFGTNKPIVGINLGNLGFLAEIDTHSIDSAIKRIQDGDYYIENRMVLEVNVNSTDINSDIVTTTTDYALNDAVITAKNMLRMLHINTYINNNFLEYIPGDGVIIATPTGSTAYSLSAGGPLVEPDVEMMIITPICPHTLYSRSCITSSDRTIKVALDDRCDVESVVTIDGQNTIDIKKNDTVTINKASFSVNIIRLNPENFFDVLRTKIYNRGEKNKKNEI